ncbi:uncharacterized protein LOC101862804 [Aplysia californica]|uniref:Uncharacterized protein LOC101862804 n=1 Tax=Aplysia californica TaxID=6500 RepID=A0ABM1VUX1_APLCA|nr:uncharacterized protein LOC101862804 [Aplysia californica]
MTGGIRPCLKVFFLVFIVWVGIVVCGFIFQSQLPSLEHTPMSNIAWKASSLFLYLSETSRVSNGTSQEECSFPNLDPFDPVIMPYVKRFPPISCEKGLASIVYLDRYFLKVNKTKLQQKFPGVKFGGCTYRNLYRKDNNDFEVVNGSESEMFSNKIKLTMRDENLLIGCFDSERKLISRSYMTVVQLKPDVEFRCEKDYRSHLENFQPRETLSVLMVGTDGMSKQNFVRSMPKTRNFLLKNLSALELRKYNKLGLNTFPNVMPLLTGKHYTEFADEWKWDEPLDKIDYAFLWNDFRRVGYRTAMLMDRVQVTAFHYQKKGWHKQFVDYNNRPVVEASEPDKLVRLPDSNCVGDVPEMAFIYDTWTQLTQLFNNTRNKPYFGYSFISRLTHDNQNRASAGDELYLNFLSDLHTKRVLNNTLLLFFSDHGERFGPIRATYNGIIEGRTPYMFLVFPPWFYQKYPGLTRALKTNQDRLTSHFDVHATLKDVVHFTGETRSRNSSRRGISLFGEIPKGRTCEQAGIPAEYCVCNKLAKADVSPTVVHQLAYEVVNHVISKTGEERKLCAKLSLESVISVLVVNENSLGKTNETKEKEEEGKVKKEKEEDVQVFQLSVKTKPGGALYEATVTLSKKKKVTVIGDISRLNMYRGQAECIEDSRKRPFCYCPSLVKP